MLYSSYHFDTVHSSLEKESCRWRVFSKALTFFWCRIFLCVQKLSSNIDGYCLVLPWLGLIDFKTMFIDIKDSNQSRVFKISNAYEKRLAIILMLYNTFDLDIFKTNKQTNKTNNFHFNTSVIWARTLSFFFIVK